MPKSEQRPAGGSVEEDVVGFHVAMHHTTGMRVSKGVADLA